MSKLLAALPPPPDFFFAFADGHERGRRSGVGDQGHSRLNP
jgi:hypothetical protein